jgi:RNA polymerase sigma-54 factor
MAESRGDDLRLWYRRPAQEELRQLVAAESRPLSDQELATLLAERGHPIARRTVAKYRDQLGIPPQQRRARRG